MAHKWQDGNSQINKRNEAYLNYQKKAAQMTKQQQLIEQKKLEIQKRMEEKKKKETEEALKKLNDDKMSEEVSKSKRSNYHSYSKGKHWPGREKAEEMAQSVSAPANIFNNDGSFLEQFQKISGVKVEARKRSSVVPTSLGEIENGDRKKKEEKQSSEIPTLEKSEEGDKLTGKFVSSHENILSVPKVDQPSQMVPQQNMQHHMIQHQHMMQHHPMHHQQPPMRHPMFPPQPMPPPMPMSYPPQFNPMHCGMMVPPPMAPSSIPPPAPLNPGSIPSPSPLQPCSIPSPSPLQPYAIPPPSPLIPHSIPPPSPMVPHSIPPPSPLTPHSIPPPLPLRPQSIPPPVQRPPMFLSMVPPPPPPPPPPEEEKHKAVSSEKNSDTKPESDSKSKPDIQSNVKDLFNNDDYSSSEDEEDIEETVYGPNLKRSHSDSESDYERKSSNSYSDKESDAESDPKMDSELDSDLGQESQPISALKSEPNSIFQPYPSVVIEDTQTQFPSDTKDSSNTGETAPPDLSSEGDSIPGPQKEAGLFPIINDQDHWQGEVKKEKEEDNNYESYDRENKSQIKEEEIENKNIDLEFKEIKSFKVEIKQEVSSVIKEDIFSEGPDSNYKADEPEPKKKRRSRWATNDENVDMLPTMTLPPPPPPPGLPPIVRPPGVGPVGMVVPSALGIVNTIVPPMPPTVPSVSVPGMSGPMISKVTRTDPAFLAYAMKSFGRTNLTEAEWKKAEDHYKINLLYQDMMRKKEQLQRIQAAGRNKYEYDSDEETEGGTWEHKLRSAEMEATQLWADELTEQAKGKHHIGDFLPPDELARFMEKYEALKEGREPDLSDYKEFKLKEDNIGFQMLQKLGWTEGQGLGPDGSGIMDPVNKATMRPENQGLGIDRPEDIEADDDEYDAYRKRMMLAYRFRPNPMNNPRRPYY